MAGDESDGHGGERSGAGSSEGREYRSSWTQGPHPTQRRDAYGERSQTTGAGRDSEHGASPPPPWQGREHDPDYRQWRDEQMRSMDRDYESWRRERFSKSFAEWRAIRAAQDGLRTGSGPPITHADRERELRGPEWPERWDDGSAADPSRR